MDSGVTTQYPRLPFRGRENCPKRVVAETIGFEILDPLSPSLATIRSNLVALATKGH